MNHLQQMFSLAMLDKTALITHSNSLETAIESNLLIALYLSLGAMGEDMGLTDEEVMANEGECNFIEKVVAFAPVVSRVAEIAVEGQITFPGVFLYEVVESYGAYLRKGGLNQTKAEQIEELLKQATDFFEEDFSFAADELHTILG